MDIEKISNENEVLYDDIEDTYNAIEHHPTDIESLSKDIVGTLRYARNGLAWWPLVMAFASAESHCSVSGRQQKRDPPAP